MSGKWILDDDQSFYHVEPGEYLNKDDDNYESCSPDLNGLTLRNDSSDHSPTDTTNAPWLAIPCGTDGQNLNLVDNSGPEIEESTHGLVASSSNQKACDQDQIGCVSSHVGIRNRRGKRKPSCDLSTRGEGHNGKRRSIGKDLTPFHKASILDENLLSVVSNTNLVMGFNTRLPQSRFDGYIHALRQLIRCSAEKSTLANNIKRAITAEGVLWVVRESWPAAEGYWNLTATFKGFLHAELWRNFPCERTYRQLPPEYKPTKLQLLVPHSPMIDWMPWPDVRDLAIRYQDQINTDELFRMAIMNVVAHRKRLSESQSGSYPDMKSFRVWDLVCLEKSNGTNPLAEPGLVRKPVLHSPSARALVRTFDLEYDEFATQKLDDCFFEAFPSLYCDTAASGWTIQTFPHVMPEDVGYPADLTRSAVLRLKSKFEALIGTEIVV